MKTASRFILAFIGLSLALLAQYIPLGAVFPVASSVIPYCASVGSYPAAPTSTSIAGWWPATNALCSGSACANLGAVTTITDGSGGGHTATKISGTATYHSSGGPNNSAYITLSSSGTFTFTQVPSSDSASVYAVYNLPTISNGTNYTIMGGAVGTVQFRIAGGAGGGNQQLVNTSIANMGTGTTTLSVNTWYQGNALVSGNSASHLYDFHLNRASDGSSNSVPATNPAGSSSIGAWSNGSTEPFNGSFADIFVYSVVSSSPDRLANECYLYGKYAL